MASLVQSFMYGAINTDYTTTIGFYVIKFLSEEYTLQNNTIIDEYICSMQENTNCYWKQQPLQHTIIVTTRTIIHPRLDVITIRYAQDIPNNVCNTIQAKNPYKEILLV